MIEIGQFAVGILDVTSIWSYKFTVLMVLFIYNNLS